MLLTALVGEERERGGRECFLEVSLFLSWPVRDLGPQHRPGPPGTDLGQALVTDLGQAPWHRPGPGPPAQTWAPRHRPGPPGTDGSPGSAAIRGTSSATFQGSSNYLQLRRTGSSRADNVPPSNVSTSSLPHTLTSQHLLTSSPPHLSTSSPIHLFTSPPSHLSTSSSLHLSTSSPLHLLTYPPCR